jgi:hypothetical protein
MAAPDFDILVTARISELQLWLVSQIRSCQACHFGSGDQAAH